ncbi:DNA polymerase [Patescibacteria group bacterium]
MLKTSKKKKLVLLDAHAILHRAYHALPDFTSDDGEPTGALYGVSLMLIKIINELKPDYIVACYDLPEPTFRKEVYEDYKSGRKKPNEDLIHQINRSRDIFEVFNIPIYDKSGFEADDILGTIVEQVKNEKDLDVIIASGDMDTMQLVSGDKVKVYTLKKGVKDTITYNEDAVIERFGFVPELLPDFKGLRGDPSDNIIGIVGIGEKTATILIQEFGTIEGIYKKLKKNPKDFEGLVSPRIVGLLEEGEEEAFFSKELAIIRRDAPIKFKIPKKDWREAFNLEDAIELFQKLNFRTLVQRIRSDFGGDLLKETTNISEPDSEEFKEIAIALWLLNSSITNPTLDDILDFAKTRDFEKAKEIILSEIKKRDLEKVYKAIELPLISVVDEMENKGIKVDTDYLKKLSLKYHKDLSKLEKSIWKQAGEEFNINSPKQLGEVLFKKMELPIKGIKKTAGGAYSTRESELEKLLDVNPIISEILKYREFQKLLSTYIDNLPNMVDKKGRLHTTLLQTGTTTGRMSSNTPNLQNIPTKSELGRKIRNAFVVDKGFRMVSCDYSQIDLRLAAILSEDEKLINIFKRGEDIHTAVASEVFSVSSNKVDKEMRRRAKVINFGILYGMGINSLKKNLGDDTTLAEARKFYNDYFDKFKTLAKYLEDVKKETGELGYTKTLFGRRRYFEGIKSKIPYVKAMAERMAINAPVQGSSADVTKLAMIKVGEYLKKEGLEKNVFMLLQVHDEIIFEIKDNLVEKVAPKIKEIMESVISLEESKGVPLIVNILVGDNWGGMKDFSKN